MSILTIRKLADKTVGDRVTRFDPETGAKKLINPVTPGDDHESWPLAGVRIEGDPPAECTVPTSFVATGRAEGWLEVEGERVVHEPGGPPSNPWAITHTFVQGDALVIHAIDGDVRYRVVGQPGKHDDPNQPSGKRVDWFYVLRLEG